MPQCTPAQHNNKNYALISKCLFNKSINILLINKHLMYWSIPKVIMLWVGLAFEFRASPCEAGALPLEPKGHFKEEKSKT
jgi:hypothetical protein